MTFTYNNLVKESESLLTHNTIVLDYKTRVDNFLDKIKIEQVIEENNVKLFVLLENQLTKEYIAGLTQLARVAS